MFPVGKVLTRIDGDAVRLLWCMFSSYYSMLKRVSKDSFSVGQRVDVFILSGIRYL